ncbi:MAG: MFS transporter [Chloroflexi bacterium]|nr:MFS transporter [Chloroflexota bacterium]
MDKRAPIFALVFLGYMGYGVILPVLSLYAESLGASFFFIGVIISAYAAAQLTVPVLAGRLSDRVGRKLLVVVGFIGVAVAAALYTFVTQPLHFFILQIAAGLSIGCVWSPLLAQLTDLTPPQHRGKAMGIFNLMLFMGIGLGPLLGGYVASSYGFLAVFQLWAVIAVVAGLLSMFFFEERAAVLAVEPKRSLPGKAVEARLIKEGAFVSFLSTCTLRSRSGFCSGFNHAILPLYAVAAFSISQEMVGGLLFIHGVLLALFTLPSGVISDRLGRKWPAVSGAFVATTGIIMYYFAGSYWLLFVAVALAGAGDGFKGSALGALVGDLASPGRRGEAFGFYVTAFHVGVVVAGFAFGLVADLAGLRATVLSWGMFSLALSFSGLLINSVIARGALPVKSSALEAEVKPAA